MILKLLIGFLVFDGVLAILFWLLITYESSMADRKIEEAYRSLDHAIDDGSRRKRSPQMSSISFATGE